MHTYDNKNEGSKSKSVANQEESTPKLQDSLRVGLIPPPMVLQSPPSKPSEQKDPSHIQSNPIQRDDTGGETVVEDIPEPGSVESEDTATWRVPFGGGTAVSYGQAIEGIDHISTFLFFNQSRNMSDYWEEQFDQVRDDCFDLSVEYRNKGIFGALAPVDVEPLRNIAEYSKSVYEGAVADTKRKSLAALRKIKGDRSLDTKIEDLQERLHFAFIEGADEEHIQSVQESLGAIKDLKEKVDQVAGWAKTAATLLKQSNVVEFFDKFDEVSGKIGEVIGFAEDVVSAAKIVYGLSTQNGATGDFAALNAMESGLDAIDLGMSFVKVVPVFGTLWSEYYSPMTRECLRLLRVIAKQIDKQNRDLALYEWMGQGDKYRMDDGSPRIPTGLRANFPGGQPVLSYMWNQVNGNGGSPTSAVRSFFVEHEDQFNAGIPEGGVKLRTESTWEFLDPFSWGNEDRAVNLPTFVSQNKDMIWAMLYGSIPQNV